VATIHRIDEDGVVAEIMSSSWEGSNSTPFGESDRKGQGDQNHAACIKDEECYRTADRIPLICAFLVFYAAGKRYGGKDIAGGIGLCGSEKRLIEVEIIRNECQARQAVERARPMLLGCASREAICQIVSTGAPCDDVCTQRRTAASLTAEYTANLVALTNRTLRGDDFPFELGPQLSDNLPY
jgi:hypothetical protein